MSEPAHPRAKHRKERIGKMSEEILDVAGAAELLGVAVGTVYKLAREGKVPGTKVGKEWRFAKKTLIDWVARGGQGNQLVALIDKLGKKHRRR